jgi:hypothetical protein
MPFWPATREVSSALGLFSFRNTDSLDALGQWGADSALWFAGDLTALSSKRHAGLGDEEVWSARRDTNARRPAIASCESYYSTVQYHVILVQYGQWEPEVFKPESPKKLEQLRECYSRVPAYRNQPQTSRRKGDSSRDSCHIAKTSFQRVSNDRFSILV